MNRYITPQKLNELKEELERLISERKEIAKRIHDAQDMGDLAENAEYAESKEAQAFNEGKILDLKSLIKEAIIISDKKNCEEAEVGCLIKVQNHDGKREFSIVGSTEADPLKGRISNESPLGRAFLGKKKGDEVMVQTPKGKIHYKILKIN
jgi:transcription elongation factor GreA